MKSHAISCNIMRFLHDYHVLIIIDVCCPFGRMMSDDVGCQDLRRRLSIHFLQHLGGFLHPGDRHRSHPPGHRNSGTKNGKRGGAAAARPQICAPCHWPPASDLRLEEILYHVILWCIYIYSTIYIYNVIICDILLYVIVSYCVLLLMF